MSDRPVSGNDPEPRPEAPGTNPPAPEMPEPPAEPAAPAPEMPELPFSEPLTPAVPAPKYPVIDPGPVPDVPEGPPAAPAPEPARPAEVPSVPAAPSHPEAPVPPAVPEVVPPAQPAVAAPAASVGASAAPPMVGVTPPPVLVQPSHTRQRGAGFAVTIAIVGVLASAIVGAAAGFFGARVGAGHGAASTATSETLTPAQIKAGDSDEPVAAAAAIAVPSVVNIDVTDKSSASGLPSGHPVVPSGGTGSGVAYKAAPGGGTYIITNDHVVSNAAKIVVTPADGGTLDAVLVGTDPETDIAVVKVDATLKTISVADSEKLVVGQLVVAIGSPFGLQHSVSSGVVSAVHRSITSGVSGETSSSANPLVDAIQTDAAINPGNSGGALVDRYGRLVGINSAIFTDSGSNAGVGFSIPSDTAIRIADQLIANGKAEHPFLGVEGQTVSPAQAKAAGLSKAEGAYVVSVFAGTGAAKAGLKKGDIVTAVDTTPIRTMDDLILAVRRHAVGDTVTLSVWRDRAAIQIRMTVGDKPANL